MEKTEESVALGRRIRQVRSEQGLNQAEFAKAIGSSRDTIARSEIGNQNPNEKVLRQICKAFGTNFMWLLTGDLEHHGKESYDKLTEENNKLKKVILEQKATIAALERTIVILARQLRGGADPSND
jgi:transcriptional regulator with XRE-family HTH domain